MKKVIKKLLTNIYAISPEQVISAIERSNCRAVSFDIFDTLIKRSVPEPKDVFSILEKQYKQNFDSKISIGKLREKAEARAAELTGHRNVNIREIYRAINKVSEKEREWLIEEEIRIEYAVCQRHLSMGRVYDWCVSKNIPIILVSDMYLPHEVIAELLHKAGYVGWKSLYISAEENKNKASGDLFSIVLNKEGLKPAELVHIGDALRGDYFMPLKQGIKAVLLKV